MTDRPTTDDTAFHAALVEEATKKSAIAWVAPVPATRRWYDAPPPQQPVWLLWHDGAAYLLHGGIEQPAPGVARAERVAVAVRSKDQGGRLLTWLARASTVEPGSDEWAAVTPLLLGKRLNLPDGEAAVDRWALESTITRLTPTGQLVEAPGRQPADREAAPPPPTPATTPARLPFAIGSSTTKRPKGRRRRRRTA